jgi:hypothetical protein
MAPQEENATKTLYRQVSRMHVSVYHERLDNVYIFVFLDDVDDFMQPSYQFNQILDSTRFLV